MYAHMYVYICTHAYTHTTDMYIHACRCTFGRTVNNVKQRKTFWRWENIQMKKLSGTPTGFKKPHSTPIFLLDTAGSGSIPLSITSELANSALDIESSQNYRILWVGRDLIDCLIPIPLPWAETRHGSCMQAAPKALSSLCGQRKCPSQHAAHFYRTPLGHKLSSLQHGKI